MKIKFTCIIFLITFQISNTLIAQDVSVDYYRSGLKQKYNGEWIKALNTWFQGFSSDEINPNIGFAYIETVAEENQSHFNDFASEIYMWGISGDNYDKYTRSINIEAKTIIPLLEDDEAKEWNNLIKNSDKYLLVKIREFWLKNDPTPTTKLNERLIEHKYRISYARKSYILDKKSIYQTDDRGPVFVKYGKPQIIKYGNLANVAELQYWVPDMRARSKIEQDVVTFPTYELWVYDNVFTNKKLSFLFAEAMGTPFKLVKGIEELIPGRGFRGFNRFPIGIYVQLMYYQTLSLFDDTASERYSELSSNMERYNSGTRSAPSIQMLKGIQMRFAARDKENLEQKYAPKVKSQLDEFIRPINIVEAHTRLLDKNNNPKLAFIQISLPTQLNIAKTITNTLIIHNNQWKEVGRINAIPEDPEDAVSVFMIDHVDSTYNYTLVSNAITLKPHYTVTKEGNTALNIFVGKKRITTPGLLNTDLTELEISDLIVGIDLPETSDLVDYPFPVMPTKSIYRGDLLKVYLEIYHLLLGESGQTSYRISFKMTKSGKKGLLNKFIGRGRSKDIITQEYINQSRDRRVNEFVTFDISKFKDGEYEFLIEVTDLISGKSKYRIGEFIIDK